VVRRVDGAIWFGEYNVNKIGRIDVTGAVSEYDVPTANSLPAVVADGPDGSVYFTEGGRGRSWRPTTARRRRW
jgi:virginiamycin B lyase